MKICGSCKTEKPKIEFSKRSDAKDGLQHVCKSCATARAVAWQKAHPERRAVTCAKWSKANPENVNKRSAQWRKNNKAYFATWNEQNRGKLRAKYALRRARKLQATPAWSDKFLVEEIYDLAVMRTRLTGVSHHVDHVVPLQSKLVCGLHCEQNFAVIPARDNISKNNRTWPDMP